MATRKITKSFKRIVVSITVSTLVSLLFGEFFLVICNGLPILGLGKMRWLPFAAWLLSLLGLTFSLLALLAGVKSDGLSSAAILTVSDFLISYLMSCRTN